MSLYWKNVHCRYIGELFFQALFEAGENRIGTVCSVLVDILTNRSEAQLCKSKCSWFFQGLIITDKFKWSQCYLQFSSVTPNWVKTVLQKIWRVSCMEALRIVSWPSVRIQYKLSFWSVCRFVGVCERNAQVRPDKSCKGSEWSTKL